MGGRMHLHARGEGVGACRSLPSMKYLTARQGGGGRTENHLTEDSEVVTDGDVPNDTHRQAGAGEGVAPHEVGGDAHLWQPPQRPHLVLHTRCGRNRIEFNLITCLLPLL